MDFGASRPTAELRGSIRGIMRWSVLALSLPLAFACTDDSRRPHEGSGDGGVFRRADTGVTQAPDSGVTSRLATPADLIFVVDNSVSMAEAQERLARGFEAFVDALGDHEGLRVGVVSTDLGSPDGERGGLITQTYSDSFPFNLQSSDNSSCTTLPVEHGCFRDGNGAASFIDSSELSRDELLVALSAAVRLGTCGDGSERGLDAMLRALEFNGCLAEPFIRADANLVVVFVTDEDDLSTVPIPQAVTELASLKPLEQTRVVVIAGLWEGGAASCAPLVGTACGGLCATPPAEGSHVACRPGSGACADGEFCDSSRGWCENEALLNWSDATCHWCVYYGAPDCCSALAGPRYVEFARTFESAAASLDPSIPMVGCDGSGPRPVCLLESICQVGLEATMARIATKILLSPDD